ncbi:MAG: hypothetical protein ACLVJ6_06035 [Merdibacter sp.]
MTDDTQLKDIAGEVKGHKVVADAHIPVELKSSEIDLCCIIGNLFDNATRPCAVAEDQLSESPDMKNTQLYISFTNFTADASCKGRKAVSAQRAATMDWGLCG